MRIDPDRVKTAYLKIHAKPRRHVYSWTDDLGQFYCCGLTALCIGEGKCTVVEADDDAGLRFFGHNLGLPQDFLRGFIGGFDGSNHHDANPEYLEGHRNGEEVFRAVAPLRS